ncbi:flagellar basal body rod protein FlgC [Phaeovulum vinaykumarii]|uniref:Flagellar basal body rod protein FlgB n=1 Tax=Phaeovulum vinaykumarii TaxID=407234 RepID=A0A1N7KVT2_9RHOB|nr:flagellar basal body rod protein FlgC [Phaeovulum vinaykumarii]SIS65520.1 flagellar basal-body rod protein FlgC [Phaeovulum vinaykumarii]SOC01252.1 flagellar basal-body rod protein FlgC [Phaeovulum vinaykumarii]
MSDFSTSLKLSASAMQAQSQRLRHVSENIANADTPGYHRKTVAFQEVMEGGVATGGVKVGPVELDRRELTRIYDPGHPLADDNGYYDGSNVDLVVEIADAREAQRSYEANLKMFDQARQMSSSLSDLLRR